MNYFTAIAEAIMIASAISIDAFAASFAYGSNKIKIPIMSTQVINIVCSSILGISLVLGNIVRQYISSLLVTIICFGILFVLGLIKLLDSVTKSIIKKYNNLNKKISFSMFNFKFILNLYANPEDADVDESRTISPMEAASLAIALSLDGFAVGFGAAIGNINGLTVFLCSLVINLIAVVGGVYIGGRIAKKIPFNLSWISGMMLISMGFLKLM